MPRSLAIGNGKVLLTFDAKGQLKDFYFPHVGLENHVGEGSLHKIGVWSDGAIYWLDNESWRTVVDYQPESLASNIVAVNESLKLEIKFIDLVYNEKNIFIRRLTINNLDKRKREIKIYFSQQFKIYENDRGNTAYYDPQAKAIIHYKGRRNFVVAGEYGGKSFNDYSIGLFGVDGKEGTWRDAEDGALSKNAIAHGSVDSTIGFTVSLGAKGSSRLTYWITCSKLLKEAVALHNYILKTTPDHILESTQDYWKAWVNKYQFSFYGLNDKTINLFKKSLLIARAHTDFNGAIIASGDSEMLQHGRDTYDYMWPRDAAFTALMFDKTGYFDLSHKFFNICNELVSEEGYLLHKYRSDLSVGSSWHPWVKNGKRQLAIQEDETALALYALWEHYQKSRDLEFVEEIYNSFIKKSANFLLGFRDKQTKLPLPTYDLWEERLGVSTFTTATVYGGLVSAGNFAKLLGKEKEAEKFLKGAEEVKSALLKYLYDSESGSFYRMLAVANGGGLIADKTVDASAAYGVFSMNVLEKNDERLRRAFRLVENKLCCKTKIGGVARYEGDKYHEVKPDLPGNPWLITTFWLAKYFIALAKKEKDLDKVKEILNWAVGAALPSGILSEQLNPLTGEQISAAPLVWSHVEFVLVVIAYLEKLEEFGLCKACNPVK